MTTKIYFFFFFFRQTHQNVHSKKLIKKTKKEVLINSFEQINTIQCFEYLYHYKIASTLNHRGIVKIIGFRYPLNEEEKTKRKIFNAQYSEHQEIIYELTGYIIVFKFVKNSGISTILSNYLSAKGNEQNFMNPTIRIKIIYGVASIMNYLHQQRITHNYLNIKNILIDENYEPKIIGFEHFKYEGTIIFRDNDSEHIHQYFIAPEVILNSDSDYTFYVDVYAFAYFLYRMFQFALFKSGLVNQKDRFMSAVVRGVRLKRQENIPDEYWELIQWCWLQTPEKKVDAY